MGEIDYQDWYPEVPPVMDTNKSPNSYTPTNRSSAPGSEKEPSPPTANPAAAIHLPPPEIFDWMIANRYQPEIEARGRPDDASL